MKSKGWIGVDLDRTFAHYTQWRGVKHIGKPIPRMLKRVKKWLKEGKEVRIFTARVDRRFDDWHQAERTIQEWTIGVCGKMLLVTNVKDKDCEEIWDDKAVGVEENTGKIRRRGRAKTQR